MFSFLGIGAQKAGTTWLYQMLARHPAVDFPGRRDHPFWDAARYPGIPVPGLKEHHFWNWGGATEPEAIAGYLGQFNHPSLMQGEITPAYALLPPDRIALLYASAPALRLFYIVRDPVERAWSAALMALKRAEMTLDEASDAWFLDHFRSRGSLARGDYEDALRRWGAVFPPEQLLLVFYEEIAADPRRFLTRVADHLGIDPAPLQALPDAVLTERVFTGGGPPLRESLRPALTALYQPRTDSLAAYVGRPPPWSQA